eukprot:4688663-Pyramimonas_sp.AAC.1
MARFGGNRKEAPIDASGIPSPPASSRGGRTGSISTRGRVRTLGCCCAAPNFTIQGNIPRMTISTSSRVEKATFVLPSAPNTSSTPL